MKRIVLLGLFVLACFLLPSCSGYSDDLEFVLQVSGENSKELEHVMVHYKNDFLKRKAAIFLIENMLGKGSIEYVFRESDSAYLRQKPRPDVTAITSAYLIENIDLAFDVWRRYPWCRDLSFDVFCRKIVPYRVRQEPLDRWRAFYFDRYKAVADSLAHAGASMPEVVFFINSRYGKDYLQKADKIPGDLSVAQIEQLGGGTCDHLALNAVQVMRAIGIPLDLDILPYHGKVNGGHVYNSFTDEQGRFFYFSPYEREPERNQWIAPLVQRVSYALLPKSEIVRNERNAQLVSRILENVTKEYYNVRDVKLKVRMGDTLVYLATFNRGDFGIVAQSEVNSGVASFEKMSCGLLYFPIAEDQSKLLPVGDPFVLMEAGPEFIVPVDCLVLLDGIKTYDVNRVVELGSEPYILMSWDRGWQIVSQAISTDSFTLDFGKVSVQSLFLVYGETYLGRMQRPFLIKDGIPNYY